METRKVIQIGSSVGVTLPKALLEANNISIGDELEIQDTAAGVLITTQKTSKNSKEKIIELTKNFVERYRDDLEALADK